MPALVQADWPQTSLPPRPLRAVVRRLVQKQDSGERPQTRPSLHAGEAPLGEVAAQRTPRSPRGFSLQALSRLQQGGRGIRTLGTPSDAQRFSRPPHSTALASLRGARGRTVQRESEGYRDGGGTSRHGQPRAPRRARKNARSSSEQSAARTPPTTSGRWLSCGTSSTSRTEPAAPAFGSAQPKTTRGIRERTIAPAHIAQGSRVT